MTSAIAGFTICASKPRCRSTRERPTRNVSRESARRRRRTAVDHPHLWRIASTTLESVGARRPRISTVSQMNSMRRLTFSVTTTRTCLTDGRLIVRLANLLRVHTRRLSMKFTIQVLIESPDALALSIPVQTIERSCDRIEDVGLRLGEAKKILSGLQDQLVRQQLADHLQKYRPCACCRRPRTIKGYHRLRFRSG